MDNVVMLDAREQTLRARQVARAGSESCVRRILLQRSNLNKVFRAGEEKRVLGVVVARYTLRGLATDTRDAQAPA